MREAAQHDAVDAGLEVGDPVMPVPVVENEGVAAGATGQYVVSTAVTDVIVRNRL
jgi:hypothetical protein